MDIQRKQLPYLRREFGSLKHKENMCSQVSSASSCDDKEQDDDGQRILFLLHHCKGKPREAIEKYIMLPLSGYRKACDTLRRLFGRTYKAGAVLKGLNGGSNIKDNDEESQSRLAIKMEIIL